MNVPAIRVSRRTICGYATMAICSTIAHRVRACSAQLELGTVEGGQLAVVAYAAQDWRHCVAAETADALLETGTDPKRRGRSSIALARHAPTWAARGLCLICGPPLEGRSLSRQLQTANGPPGRSQPEHLR
jgi:hypothetical protein